MTDYEVSIGISKIVKANDKALAKDLILRWLSENRDHINVDEKKTVFKRG